jgi:outer membrane protein TolC
LASVTDILTASSALLAAEAQRLTATVDVMVSETMLNRAVGRMPSAREVIP